MTVALDADLTRPCVREQEPEHKQWPPTNAEAATYTARLIKAFDECAGRMDEIRGLQP